MSTPTGGHAFLRELELNVSTELTLAETGPPEEEAVSAPIDEWLTDPADDQRYEVSLRVLLGAVEVVDNDSRPGGDPPQLPEPATGPRAGPAPTGCCADASNGTRLWSSSIHLSAAQEKKFRRLVNDEGHTTTRG